MESIILEFEEKVKEINEYFKFINTTTHLNIEDNKKIKVSKDVYNILKSNLFLLLYNLIESSFKMALNEICNQISSDKLEYKNVISEIKKIWIQQEYKNFENNPPYNINKSEFIMNKISNITQDIVSIDCKKVSRLSGNVNEEIIRKNLLEKYGSEFLEKEDIGSLDIIKNRRNSLAHGDETFSKCSNKDSIEELKKIKNDSIEFMKSVLKHMQDYLQNQKYKI